MRLAARTPPPPILCSTSCRRHFVAVDVVLRKASFRSGCGCLVSGQVLGRFSAGSRQMLGLAFRVWRLRRSANLCPKSIPKSATPNRGNIDKNEARALRTASGAPVGSRNASGERPLARFGSILGAKSIKNAINKSFKNR